MDTIPREPSRFEFGIPLAIFLSIGAFLLGSFSGRKAAFNQVQREAILNKAAEWRADENGKPVFTWKESP